MDIRILLPNGEMLRERRKAPVSSKSGAKRWGEAREREIMLTDPTKEKKEAPTLKEFGPRYIAGYAEANRLKPSGIWSKKSIIKNHLEPMLGHRRLDNIGDEDVQRLKAKLVNKSPKTTNNVLTVLNTMLKTAVKWKVIDKMPCTIELLKVSPSKYSFYDFAEYERLLRAAKKTSHATYLAILLGGDAGLRRGEIIALEWVDMDFERGWLTVEHSDWRGIVTVPKGGRSRRLPMTKRLQAALKAHKHLRGSRVFYRDDGQTITPKILQKWVMAAQRRAGLRDTGGVHLLRHTFCSHLAMRGAPARAIQELAGHKDLMTTQRYMHLSPAAIKGAIELLEQGRGEEFRGDMVETEGLQ